MRRDILSGNKKKYTEKTEGHQNHNSGGGGNRLFLTFSDIYFLNMVNIFINKLLPKYQ